MSHINRSRSWRRGVSSSVVLGALGTCLAFCTSSAYALSGTSHVAAQGFSQAYGTLVVSTHQNPKPTSSARSWWDLIIASEPIKDPPPPK